MARLPRLRTSGSDGSPTAIALTVLLALGTSGLAGQDALPPPAERTHAIRGATVGAVTGGILGGLAFGVLAEGLCDLADCSGSFREGLVIGLAVGGAMGGTTGLVVGSALPAGGRRNGGRSWSVGAGVRVAGDSELEGLGPWVSAGTLDGTTDRVRFGVEVAFFGRTEELRSFEITNRDGSRSLSQERAQRTGWMAGLIATRALGADPDRGAHALASVSVYPVREVREFSRRSAAGELEPSFGGEDRSWTPLPGIGVGLGGRWPLGPGVRLLVRGRGHLILGAGNNAVLPVATLAVGLELGGPQTPLETSRGKR